MKNKKSIWDCFFPTDDAVSEYEYKDEKESFSGYENSIIIEEDSLEGYENSIIVEEDLKEPSTNMTILEFMRINNNSIEKLAR